MPAAPQTRPDDKTARKQPTLVCLRGRHVVDALVDVALADPITAQDLGHDRICAECVEALRAGGLVVEEVA